VLLSAEESPIEKIKQSSLNDVYVFRLQIQIKHIIHLKLLHHPFFIGVECLLIDFELLRYSDVSFPSVKYLSTSISLVYNFPKLFLGLSKSISKFS